MTSSTTLLPSSSAPLSSFQQSEYYKTMHSIPDDQLDKWDYVPNEEAGLNEKLDGVSYDEIRTELDEKTDLNNIYTKNPIKSGMPESGAAWIWGSRLPGSNCSVVFFKHYLHPTPKQTSDYFRKHGKYRPGNPAYGVLLDNSFTYASHWRVYTIEEAVNRVKYWIKKLSNVNYPPPSSFTG